MSGVKRPLGRGYVPHRAPTQMIETSVLTALRDAKNKESRLLEVEIVLWVGYPGSGWEYRV